MKDILNFSMRIILTESMIFLCTVEIHQTMIIEASEPLDRIQRTPYQKY